MFQSLRFRLTLFNALVLAIALLLSGFAVHFIVSRNLTRLMDGHLQEQFQHLEHTALSGRIGEGAGDHTPPEGPAVRVIVFDLTRRPKPTDQMMAIPGFAEAYAGQEDIRRIEKDGSQYRQLIRRVEKGDAVPYVIQIISPMGQLDTAMHQLNGALLHLIPFALIFSVAGGAFLTGRSLKPVGMMAAAAESINAQSLSQRLPGESRDELGRLATVFNRMLSRLEDSFENQRRFTADASHELRTPLTALKANTSLALSPGATADDMKTALVAADKAADRMSRLVNDLLFLSRSDAGQLEPKMELVCVNSVAEAVAKMLEAQAGADSISISVEAQSRIEAYADEHLLERLLLNLVTNALRHTNSGGRVSLQVRMREPGYPSVEVSDNGCGIAAEHLPHIFERFYSIDESRTGEGTGLGLAISKSIAEVMGAQIEVRSQAGLGSTFTIVLPRPPS